MRDPIKILLAELRLNGMLAVLDHELDKAEREGEALANTLHKLLDEEHRERQQRAMHNRIKRARIPWEWTLETFPYAQQPSVNRSQIRSLANLDFVQRAENVVFIGPTGTGKTGLATGLMHTALLNGYTARFYNAQDLLDELYASLADRTSAKVLKQMARYDVVLIDEIGYLTLKLEQVNAFFKLIDLRYSKKSTIITTNLDFPEWYDLFQRPKLVEALLDRLQHHCTTIRLSGDSLRAPTNSDAKKETTNKSRRRKSTSSKSE